MQSSSLQGRDDVDVARVTKVQVGPSTVSDREETEESGLSRANVTKLGSGRPSRLSRSSAGWNVASPNSSARDDGPDSFDLPSSSPTSSPSQRSSSQPESKRSSPGLKNVSGGNITNLSDSFELEELGHSDSSRSPEVCFRDIKLPVSFLFLRLHVVYYLLKALLFVLQMSLLTFLIK